MIDRFFKTVETKSVMADLQSVILGGYTSKSGLTVNHQTALECATVLACTRVIAEGLAQIPFKVYQKTGNKRMAATEHPLYEILYRKPNSWMTSFELRETLATHLVLARNAFCFINRAPNGVIRELLPLKPETVTVDYGRRQGDITYLVTWQDGKLETLPPANVWHLRGLSWDGIKGLDAVKLARDSIGLGLALETHSNRLFANGTRTSGALQTEAVLSPEKAKEFRDQWQELYSGLDNTGKTPVLHSGLKWLPMSMNSDQAQLLESRRFQVEQICSAFRVLPIMIGYADKTATYASAEQMFLAHVVHTLGPWIERIEQSADVQLLGNRERLDGYYAHFNTAGLLRGAHQDRAAYYSKALGAGGSPAWMTPDEIRELEELNPIGGAAGELPIATNPATPAKP